MKVRNLAGDPDDAEVAFEHQPRRATRARDTGEHGGRAAGSAPVHPVGGCVVRKEAHALSRRSVGQLPQVQHRICPGHRHDRDQALCCHRSVTRIVITVRPEAAARTLQLTDRASNLHRRRIGHRSIFPCAARHLARECTRYAHSLSTGFVDNLVGAEPTCTPRKPARRGFRGVRRVPLRSAPVTRRARRLEWLASHRLVHEQTA